MGEQEEDLTNGSGGVYRKVLRPGSAEGKGRPPPGAEVTVHYEGWLLDGHKFDSSRDREESFTFKLGVGQVIEGWDIAVAAMAVGEIGLFTCRADYAYGWEGKPPKIPVDATLRFEIELIDWTPASKPVSDMSAAERLKFGLQKRAEGTAALKAGEHADAISEFDKGVESLGSLRMLMSSASPDPTQLAQVDDALRSCLLNAAQCHLKLSDWSATVAKCDHVLGTLPAESASTSTGADERVAAVRLKALFRRGVAQLALDQFDEAKSDLKAACMLDPKSKEVRSEYERAKNAHAAHKAAERQAFGGMFGAAPSPS